MFFNATNSVQRAECDEAQSPSEQPFCQRQKKEGSLFHDLPHRSHSRGASPSQVFGSLRSLLCGVSRRKNDTQSFLLARRLFALRSLCDLGLITSKVMKHRATTATKKKELKPPDGDLSSFVLYRLNRCHPQKVNKIKGF